MKAFNSAVTLSPDFLVQWVMKRTIVVIPKRIFVGFQCGRLRHCFILCGCFFGLLTSSVVLGQDKARMLTTEEIAVLFADVLDQAEVLDSIGVQAETHWYASGYFETRWWSSNREGRATGHWMARGGERCVLIAEPSVAAAEGWQCGKILWESEGVYRSLNPDGSAHGWHRLSPLPSVSSGLLP